MSAAPFVLTENWLQPPKGAARDAAGLMHSQTVCHFLSLFCDRGRTPLQVAQDAGEIWRTHGWCGVDELATRLLARYHPHINPGALNLLQATLRERFENIEPLTGYHRKQFAPLMLGLAHLFAVTTGTEVTAVVGDLGNMGNTNAHFHNLQALADGRHITSTSSDEAEARTDQAVRVVCGIASESLRKIGVTEESRFGGDETLILVFGATEQQVQEQIDRDAVPAIEEFGARTGTHDHEYGKGKFRLRAGFGFGLASYGLNAQTRPAIDPQRAEKSLENRKIELGANRRGRLGPVVLPAGDNESEWLQLAGRNGYLRQIYPDMASAAPELTARLTEDGVLGTASAASATTADLGNLLQQELAGYLYDNAVAQRAHFKNIKQAAGALYPAQHQDLDYTLNTAEPNAQNNPYHRLTAQTAGNLLATFERELKTTYARFLPETQSGPEDELSQPDLYIAYKTPFERELIRFRETLAQAGPYQPMPALERVLGVVNPMDPSTQLLMGDVMPQVFGQFVRDTAELKTAGYLPPEATCYGLAASMHNLAGANSLLGSAGANLLLYAFAQQVIMGSFEAMGFKTDTIVAGHRGGGAMLMAIAPVIEGEDGTLHKVTPELIDDIRHTMHERNRLFQNGTLGSFLGGHGFSLPTGVDPNMKIGDIPDRRRPEYPGLDLTTHAIELSGQDSEGRPHSGSHFNARLKWETEDIITQKRITRQQTYQPVPLKPG